MVLYMMAFFDNACFPICMIPDSFIQLIPSGYKGQ